MQLNDDIQVRANAHIWRMLATAGIDTDLVSVDPAGEDWDLTSGDFRIAFGPATTETSGTAEGWDWTRYVRDDGEWTEAGTDWARDDAAMIAVLVEFAAEHGTMSEVTAEQVRALRDEAGQAGDLEQVAICDRAIEGDEAALAECGRVIATAAAMGE